MNCAEQTQRGCSFTRQLKNPDISKETLYDDANTLLEFLISQYS